MKIRIQQSDKINEITINDPHAVELLKKEWGDHEEIEVSHDVFMDYIATPYLYKKYATYELKKEDKENLIAFILSVPSGDRMCDSPEESISMFSDVCTINDLTMANVSDFYQKTMEYIDQDPFFLTHDGYMLLFNYVKTKPGILAINLLKSLKDATISMRF